MSCTQRNDTNESRKGGAPKGGAHVGSEAVVALVDAVLGVAEELYRDFEWRRTADPYRVLVSEVMLQQTQTVRVIRYYARWIEKFPTFDALAAASTLDVLEAWQGLGYNRRALALHECAKQVSTLHAGRLPQNVEELVALPGIGPATAAGVLAFAFNEPSVYLETNVRTVVLHEVWPDRENVGDKEVSAIVEAAAALIASRGIDSRVWNYALLDYGAWLKKMFPNPSRRSKHHTKQSAYEGSRRQKRARLLRVMLDVPDGTATYYARECSYGIDVVDDVMGSLCEEGFAVCDETGRYSIKN
ncbi:MAG: adenine glycosylase [Coriobacteriia bacterium]|nr:adenine glycosylase [Coriobacteriia bacterium]